MQKVNRKIRFSKCCCQIFVMFLALINASEQICFFHRISPSSSPDEEDAENSKRKQSRANRFHKTLKDIKDSDSGKKITSTLNVYSNADDEEDFDWSQFHIVGTCQDLTKRYLRLTSVSYYVILYDITHQLPLIQLFIRGS